MDIAILIMAHRNETQLNRLVEHLRRDFTVYIHVDRRSRLRVPAHPNVHLVRRRYRVYYGSFSMIQARLALLEEAIRRNHDYYLVISAQDLPLVSNTEIRSFFQRAGGKDYYLCRQIPVDPPGSDPEDPQILRRLTHYWMDESRGPILFFAFRVVRKIQCLLRWYRRLDFVVYRGSDWFNFHHESATHLVERARKDHRLMRRFRFTRLGAALFFQIILQQSPRRTEYVNDDLRYVLFEGRRHPRVLGMQDYDTLRDSGKLFGRKFDDAVDAEVIDRLLGARGEVPRP